MGDRAHNRAINNYTQVNNDMLRNSELTWGAKGLLAYMLSRPNDWSFNMKEIASNANESYGMTQKFMKELIEKNYIIRIKRGIKGVKGKFETLYYFNDRPFTREEIVEITGKEDISTTEHFNDNRKQRPSFSTTDVSNDERKSGSYTNTEKDTNTEKEKKIKREEGTLKTFEKIEKIQEEEDDKKLSNPVTNLGAYYQAVRNLLAAYPGIPFEQVAKLGKPIERIKAVVVFAKKYKKAEGWIFSAIKYDYALDSSYLDKKAEKAQKIEKAKVQKEEEEIKKNKKALDFV